MKGYFERDGPFILYHEHFQHESPDKESINLLAIGSSFFIILGVVDLQRLWKLLLYRTEKGGMLRFIAYYLLSGNFSYLKTLNISLTMTEGENISNILPDLTQATQFSAEEIEKRAKEDARILYQEKRKVEMDMIKVGQCDGNNNEITKVVIEASEYFIYEINTPNISESLRTYIHTEEEEDKNGILDRYNEIRSCIGDAKGDMYKALDPIVYKARIAHLISQALNGKPEEAKVQFTKLIDEVNRQYRSQFKNRIGYLLTALIAVFLCIGTSLAVYTQDIWNIKNIHEFIYVATAGSIGGFISISRRLQETVFARDIWAGIFVFYAIERIAIAIFASMAVFFAIKGNLAFGFFNNKGQNTLYGYIVFSMVAGFSETFLPNLLITLENKG